MTLSPERQAATQEERLHAAAQMTPAEIVQLQDDLEWWKDHSAKISVALYKITTAMMKGKS